MQPDKVVKRLIAGLERMPAFQKAREDILREAHAARASKIAEIARIERESSSRIASLVDRKDKAARAFEQVKRSLEHAQAEFNLRQAELSAADLAARHGADRLRAELHQSADARISVLFIWTQRALESVLSCTAVYPSTQKSYADGLTRWFYDTNTAQIETAVAEIRAVQETLKGMPESDYGPDPKAALEVLRDRVFRAALPFGIRLQELDLSIEPEPIASDLMG
ncbi:MAG: hypothetical protein M0015_05875 [Betaproteobacteria bacterium]|nr:hypothetical protein [Betaproteobacteria bacterium]